MTGNTHRRLVALALAALLITSALGGVGTVAASHDEPEDEGVIDSLFSSDDEDEDDEQDGILDRAKTVSSAVSGFVERKNPFADRPEQASADVYAGNVQDTFNQDSGALTDWTNARVNGSEDEDVVRLTFTDSEDNTDDVYIVTDVNNSTGEYQNARALNTSEFEATNRTVDLNYTLTPYASRNANQELETFVSDYAETGESPDKAYYAHLLGEYRGDITGTYLPSSEEQEGSGWAFSGFLNIQGAA